MIRGRLAAGLIWGALSFTGLTGPLHANDADSDLDTPFPAPFPARLSTPEGVERLQFADCRTLLAAQARLVGADTEADYRALRQQIRACEEIRWLAKLGRASRSGLPKEFRTVTETRRYPASLWPNVSDDEQQRAARPGATLQTLSGKRQLHAGTPDTLQLDGRDYGIRLRLLARGDLDGDGWEDAVFRWSAYALHGTFQDSRLVVLTRRSKHGPLSFEEWPLAGLERSR